MKKILLLLTIISIFCFPLITHANGTAILTSSVNSVPAGGMVTMTVVMSGNATAKSASISVLSYGEQLELVSGKWQKSGVMDSFDGRDGVIAFAQETNVNGNLFILTLKAKSYVATKQTVQVNIKLKNVSGTVTFDSNATAQVQIHCATHQYGGWSSVSGATCIADGKEQRSCSVCGNVDTRNVVALGHNWSTYSVTKQSTCSENGTQTRSCSRCKESESKSLDRLKHNIEQSEITKEATCTATGEKTGTCKMCGHKVVEKIAAVGHQFTEWKEKVAPTYTELGEEQRVCSLCGLEEIRIVNALGYVFETPSSIQGASIVYYNVAEVVNQGSFQENGYVNVKFKILEGDSATAKLYYVTETGAMEEISAILSEDNNYIEAQIRKSGMYVVHTLRTEEQTELPETDKPQSENEQRDIGDGIRIMNAILISLFVIETLIIVLLFIKGKIRLKGDDASES